MEEGRVIIASDAGLAVRSATDVSDAIGACLGAKGLILSKGDLCAEFFDLSTGLAGELFQKLVNYKIRTAIILPDAEAYGERFGELAYEHRSHPMIRFFRSRIEANEWLSV